MSSFLPQLTFLAVGGSVAPPLQLLTIWMEKNSRAITIVLCSVFGAFFPIRSLSGS